jgi:hypothetical protein
MGQKKDFGPAVRKAADTIHQWCPGWMQGQRTGHERKIRSPIREDKTIGSFSINEDTGEWYDFATAEGGDALTLYARIKGIRNGEARAEMSTGYRDGVDGFQTQFVSDLPHLLHLEPAQILWGTDRVEKRGFTECGHSDIPILHVGTSRPT